MREGLKLSRITEEKNVKVHGRTVVNREGIPLFWTGSGVEFQYTGSELWIEVEVDYQVFEPWIACSLNGEQLSRQPLYQGKQWICLIRNMNPESVKNIMVTREVQAMSDDSKLFLQITQIAFDGEFLPVSQRPYKLEFIGDSITSGEGTYGAKEEQDWIPAFFSSQRNYAILVAKALNADVQIISQSGWGVVSSWDNNPNCALPLFYEQVCGLVKGDIHKKLGAHQNYDFLEFQPDVVVVNLGTNDANAFEQYKTEDGSYEKEQVNRLQSAIIDFLHKIRKNSPNAYILWANGMLGAPLFQQIQEAINQYQSQSTDANVSMIRLPEVTEETIGSRCHPGYANHQEAADTLTKTIHRILEMREQ